MFPPKKNDDDKKPSPDDKKGDPHANQSGAAHHDGEHPPVDHNGHKK